MAPASQEPEPASPTTTRPEGESVDNIAQAYRDLQRGEQAATALEANLTNLENRLDALLAAFEAAEEPRNNTHGPATAKKDNEPKKDDAANGRFSSSSSSCNGQKEQ